MKLYTHDEMLDRVVGERGTARRDALEAELQSYLIGEAIKQARKEKKLTQEQLGKAHGCTTCTGVKNRERTQPHSRDNCQSI